MIINFNELIIIFIFDLIETFTSLSLLPKAASISLTITEQAIHPKEFYISIKTKHSSKAIKLSNNSIIAVKCMK